MCCPGPLLGWQGGLLSFSPEPGVLPVLGAGGPWPASVGNWVSETVSNGQWPWWAALEPGLRAGHPRPISVPAPQCPGNVQACGLATPGPQCPGNVQACGLATPGPQCPGHVQACGPPGPHCSGHGGGAAGAAPGSGAAGWRPSAVLRGLRELALGAGPSPRPLPTARPWLWGLSARMPTVMVVPVNAKGRVFLWLPGRQGLQDVF